MNRKKTTVLPVSKGPVAKRDLDQFVVDRPRKPSRTNDLQANFLLKLFPGDNLPDDWLNRWIEGFLETAEAEEIPAAPATREWERRFVELSSANPHCPRLISRRSGNWIERWMEWYEYDEEEEESSRSIPV